MAAYDSTVVADVVASDHVSAYFSMWGEAAASLADSSPAAASLEESIIIGEDIAKEAVVVGSVGGHGGIMKVVGDGQGSTSSTMPHVGPSHGSFTSTAWGGRQLPVGTSIQITRDLPQQSAATSMSELEVCAIHGGSRVKGHAFLIS